MPTASASRSATASTSQSGDDDGAQRVVAVHNCSRIGMRANPPRFSISDLFRFGRWR